MDTIPVSETLREWLMGHGMIGAGCAAGELAHPANGSSGGGGRAPMGMGKVPGPKPRQVGHREENVRNKNDEGEPFPRYVADTMAEAMSRGRVYRTRPLLIALDGGKA